MALVRDLSQAQLVFQIEGGEPDQFLVIRYRGTEGVCQLYRFEIELTSSHEAVSFDDVVGKKAVLSINTDWGVRWFHGVVSRFEMTGEGPDRTNFRLELVPELWLLTHRYNSRIFQEKSTKDIITKVLTDAGIASDLFDMSRVQGGSTPHGYRVQYRETDYNFICRLMEEEGIRWYFEQSQERHVLILADAADYTPIEDDPALPYRPPTDMRVSEEHVYRFRLGQCVRPGAVVLNDFNFENPKLNLESKQDCSRDVALEFSDYPGEFIEQGAGQTIATMRTEEFESGRVLGIGQSNSPRMMPGRTFDLTEHPADAVNRSYMVTSATHEGRQSTERTTTGPNGRGRLLDTRIHQSLLQAQRHENETIRQLAEALVQIVSRLQVGDSAAHRAFTQWLYHAGQVCKDLSSTAVASGGNPLEALAIPNLLDDASRAMLLDLEVSTYECRFECIPSDVLYRPPRATPWPVMRGTQTARVVGPAGEEIYTDNYGRVKVHFNWDREGEFKETDSCWIRVSQGMAGGQYGMMFLPRIGQEVIVDFLEGNPDKPIITGRVFNADHMPPYELPKEKTKSVIKTRSSKGGGGTNEIRFEDLKDKEQILIYAQKDLHLRANNDRVENVGHDDHLTVKEQKFETVKKSKHTEVTLDSNAKIGGKLSLEVTGDVGEKFGANHGEEVAGNYALKAKKVVVDSPEITLTAGGNFIKIDSSGVTILGTKVNINSGGSAGSAAVPAPDAPGQAIEADSAEPGKDVTYAGGAPLVAREGAPEAAGTPFEPEEEEEPSWIEIELVDEEGQPVAGVAYEITGPDGETIKKGKLGKDGRAHVPIAEPGTCQISFPKLDAEAWERAAGGGAAAQSPAAGGQSPPADGQTESSGTQSPSGDAGSSSTDTQSPSTGTESESDGEQRPSGGTQSPPGDTGTSSTDTQSPSGGG